MAQTGTATGLPLVVSQRAGFGRSPLPTGSYRPLEDIAELLRSLDAAQWSRAGTQEGVGRVALCDIPTMMAEHDDSHRAQIAAWRRGPTSA